MDKRHNEEQRVLREAIVQIFALQLRLGATSRQVNEIARTSIRTAARSRPGQQSTITDADVHRFGNILRSWHQKTRYLDRDGFPKHLRTEGKHGLKSLIVAHFPRDQFTSVFRSLKAAGLVKRDEAGKWFPTRRHAVFPSLSKELLLHFSEGVVRFVETLTRNVSKQDKGQALFERSCTVRKLPVSLAPEFRAFVNRQAIAFLEAMDDWLEARVEESRRSRAKKCSAGVYTFAFMDDWNDRHKTGE